MKYPPVSLISLDSISPRPQSESRGHVPNHQGLKDDGDKSVTMDAKKPLTITELAGEPVSRILCAALSSSRLAPRFSLALRDDHSSRSRIAPGLEQPTRGSQQVAPSSALHTGWASPPSYLALLHAGFSVPRMLPSGRWALTPPFHPCQMRCAETGRAVVSRRPAAEAIASPAV